MGYIGDAIRNMLAKGVLKILNSATKMQTVTVGLLADETAELPHIEPYGFTSAPKAGAECVAAFYDGDRSQGVVIVIGDRRYRLTKLKPGEVALHDDQGQKIHLTRSGIVVDGGGKPITIRDTPKIEADTPLFHLTGNIVADGEIMDAGGTKSMSGMRGTYNTHTHPETNTTTKVPNQEM